MIPGLALLTFLQEEEHACHLSVGEPHVALCMLAWQDHRNYRWASGFLGGCSHTGSRLSEATEEPVIGFTNSFCSQAHSLGEYLGTPTFPGPIPYPQQVLDPRPGWGEVECTAPQPPLASLASAC